VLLADLVEILMLSLAVSAMSISVSRSQMFQSLRVWAFKTSDWLGELVSCWWCVSFWFAFFVTTIYRVRVVESEFMFLDWFINMFVVMALAGLSSTLFSNYVGGHYPDEDEVEE